jgi:hypothetical protein
MNGQTLRGSCITSRWRVSESALVVFSPLVAYMLMVDLDLRTLAGMAFALLAYLLVGVGVVAVLADSKFIVQSPGDLARALGLGCLVSGIAAVVIPGSRSGWLELSVLVALSGLIQWRTRRKFTVSAGGHPNECIVEFSSAYVVWSVSWFLLTSLDLIFWIPVCLNLIAAIIAKFRPQVCSRIIAVAIGVLGILLVRGAQHVFEIERSDYSIGIDHTDLDLWSSQAWSLADRGLSVSPAPNDIWFGYHFVTQALVGQMSQLAGVSERFIFGEFIYLLLAVVAVSTIQLSAYPRVQDVQQELARSGNDQGLGHFPLFMIALSLVGSWSPTSPIHALPIYSVTQFAAVAFLIVVLMSGWRSAWSQSKMSAGLLGFLLASIGVVKVHVGVLVAIGVMAWFGMCVVRRVRLPLTLISSYVLASLGTVLILVILPAQREEPGSLFDTVLLVSPIASFNHVFETDFLGAWGIAAIIWLLGMLVVSWICVSRFPVGHSGLVFTCVAGTCAIGFFMQFPPTGESERFFVGMGLSLTALHGSLLVAGSSLRGLPVKGSRLVVFVFVGGVLAVYAFLARLPKPAFVGALLLLPVAIAVGWAVFHAACLFRAGIRFQMGPLLLACALLTSVGLRAGQNIQKEATTMYRVLSGNVSIQDFQNELTEREAMGDRIVFELAQHLERFLPASAVIAPSLNSADANLLSALSSRPLWFRSDLAVFESRGIGTLNRNRKAILEDYVFNNSLASCMTMKSAGVTHLVVHLDDWSQWKSARSCGLDEVSHVFDDYAVVHLHR